MGNTISTPSPRGGSAVFRYESDDPDEVAAVAARLRAAGNAWWVAGGKYRVGVLESWQAALAENRGTILDALVEDTGRSLLARSEFDAGLRRIDHWIAKAPALLAEESSGSSAMAPTVEYKHRFVPVGLVGVIGPWNFPLLLPLIDAVPALAAGCPVLVKPSEFTPRFVESLAQAVAQVPALAEVFAFVRGGRDTGEAVVDQADAVCFTGSVPTGRLVGARAGARLIPAFLELGGKDPLIVLADAHLDTAVDVTLRGAVIATGQACQSIERVYVHDTLFQDFVSRLVDAANRVEPNVERVDEGHIGPFIDPRQGDKVAIQLDEARARGAVQHCGGIIRRDGGVWCRPVVLTGVDHDMLLYREETFGPVIPVMPFADDEEAVRLANDSAFGLSAAVLGEQAHAISVAERLNTGAVSINDAGLTSSVGDVEKDSFGVSGVGRSRMGDSGLKRFLRRQAVLIQTAPPLPMDAFRESGG